MGKQTEIGAEAQGAETQARVRRPMKAYDLKRFNDVKTAIVGTKYLTEDEDEYLTKLSGRMLNRYLGVEEKEEINEV